MGATKREVERPMQEPAEEPLKKLTEESIEETTGEPIENSIEELKELEESSTKEQIENSIEESVESPTEEPIENSIEESVEDPIEKPIESPIEELLESPKGESIKESTEEAVDELKEEPTEESVEKHKKVVRGVVISLCTLLVIYFGMVKYFTNHFYFGSEINSVNVSGKTVEDAKTMITSELQNYTLSLKEQDGKIEKIKAADVGLKYNSDEEFQKLKGDQNPFKWILALFNTNDSKMTVELSVNEKLLREGIDKLSCFDKRNIIEPKNPSFKYVDNNYVIVDEVLGNKVDKDTLYSHVIDSILKRETEIDLELAGCYIKPQYNSKSQKIIEVKTILNKYVSSKITYTFVEHKETLDGSIINKWLIVDKNFRVVLDDEKVKDYIDKLSKTYNTIGKTRKFVTSSGKTINIGGGDYGWSINKSKETQNLIKAIKEGKTITKEPVYAQTAFSHGHNDIGNTYVEIDLAKQHIWFYKNGSLVVQGDIVTGNVSRNHSTPKGIYRLKYKQRNAVLRGPGYASPVSFWMPFNGGIGIHDAGWRSAFGGNIYRTNGSHGCINSPYNVARTIFNNIEEGTPVICH